MFRESKVKIFPRCDLFLRASHVQDIMRNRLIYNLPSRKKSPKELRMVEWTKSKKHRILPVFTYIFQYFFDFAHSTVLGSLGDFFRLGKWYVNRFLIMSCTWLALKNKSHLGKILTFDSRNMICLIFVLHFAFRYSCSYIFLVSRKQPETVAKWKSDSGINIAIVHLL